MKDKVVFITGASSGIGAAIARECFHRGANVVLTARRTDRLKSLAQELDPHGKRVLAVACDVTSKQATEAAIKTCLDKFGKLDVAIANAGFSVAGNLETLSEEDYRRQFDTNVFGVLNTVYSSLSSLKQSKGRLVIVGSVNGYTTLPGSSAYAMSKFAIRGLCNAIVHELRPSGVSVTHIAPGFVESEIRQVNNRGTYKENAPEPIPQWILYPVTKAARQIVDAFMARKREKIITNHGKFIVFLERHFPWLVSAIISTSKLHARSEPKKDSKPKPAASSIEAG